MTNEEKAREMAEEYRAVLAANTDFDVNDLDLAEEDATRLTLDMAEWKDKQFKEHLKNKVKAYKCRGEEFFGAEIKAIEEIINKLFKEE